MNRLEKLKNSLSEELSLEDDYGCDSGAACKAGFDAASAEYEKIIAELEGAIKLVNESTETNLYVYMISNKDILNKALQKLKDFRG